MTTNIDTRNAQKVSQIKECFLRDITPFIEAKVSLLENSIPRIEICNNSVKYVYNDTVTAHLHFIDERIREVTELYKSKYPKYLKYY